MPWTIIDGRRRWIPINQTIEDVIETAPWAPPPRRTGGGGSGGQPRGTGRPPPAAPPSGPGPVAPPPLAPTFDPRLLQAGRGTSRAQAPPPASLGGIAGLFASVAPGTNVAATIGQGIGTVGQTIGSTAPGANLAEIAATRVGPPQADTPPAMGAFLDLLRRTGGAAFSGGLDAVVAQMQTNAETDRFIGVEAADIAGAAFAGFVGGGLDEARHILPREKEVINRASIPSFPGPPNMQGEQAMLTPAAVLSAFFTGSDGSAWGYGAFYRGLNPEDRNPPAFFSPLTYSFLTRPADPEMRVDSADIDLFYEQDPVTGYWVLRPRGEDLPIDAGYGGYSYGYPGYGSYSYPGSGGYSYPSYGGGGGGGSSAPRAPSAGLVNWRIG